MTHTGSIFLSCLGSHKQGLWLSFQFKVSKVRMQKDNCIFHHDSQKGGLDRLFPVSAEGKKKRKRKRPWNHVLFYVLHFPNSVFKFFPCVKVPNGIKRNRLRKKLPEVNLQWNMFLSSLSRYLTIHDGHMLLLSHSLCACEACSGFPRPFYYYGLSGLFFKVYLSYSMCR